MFRYFPVKNGSLLTLLAIAVAAGAILWQPAMELVGEYETYQLNQRAKREGWVGEYPVKFVPVEVKRIGD